MAYEYEDEIKEYLRYATRPDTEKYLEMHLELTKVYKKAYLLREMTKTMLIPIEEIYAKAKAFDEIRNVDKDFYKEYGYYPNEEEWWYDASNIIEKYEELHGGQII